MTLQHTFIFQFRFLITIQHEKDMIELKYLKRIFINKCKISNGILFVVYLAPFEFDTMHRIHVTLT